MSFAPGFRARASAQMPPGRPSEPRRQPEPEALGEEAQVVSIVLVERIAEVVVELKLRRHAADLATRQDAGHGEPGRRVSAPCSVGELLPAVPACVDHFRCVPADSSASR